MGDGLKLLLLFCFATAVSGTIFRKHGEDTKRQCPEGQYNFKGSCFQCTPCGSFMYEQKSCSIDSNTVCGWCGKKPNLDEISDEVMASYQTKCLMSSLGFIGMTKLKDEYINGYDPEPKLKVKILKNNRHKEVRTGDNFQMAKDALFNLDDDSQEQELPDPTLEEGKEFNVEKVDLTSGEELSAEEMKEAISGERSGEEESAEIEEDKSTEDSKEETSSDKDYPMENIIHDRVNAFLIKKGRESNDDVQEWEVNPYLKGATIVSLKDVENKFNNYAPKLPVVQRKDRKKYDSSAEDSNERDIKWDKWVDDKVKPIDDDSMEIIEAEEELTQEYVVYESIPKKLTEKAEQELVHVFGEKAEQANFNNEIKELSPLFFVSLGMIIIATIVSLALVQIRASYREKLQFSGVPTDAQDYHMIIESSNRLEELEKKNKKAARHVHVNPGFDV